jgi:hypothetical protein
MTDTSADADRVLLEIFRRMSPAEKWLQLGALYRCGRMLAEAGARRQNPAASADDVMNDWKNRTTRSGAAASARSVHE